MVDDFDFGPFEQEQKKVPAKDNKVQAVPDYSNDFIQVSRRVKVLEDNISNLRKKILVDEQNDLNRHKKELLDHKNATFEINDLKKDIENLKRVIKEVISELQACARHEEVDVLKKYLNIWNPIKFVTEDSVERIIEEKLDELNKKE